MMNEYSNVGYIYILTNKSFPNYVKIGYADDVNRRVDQLNSSDAVPFPFEIYAVYGVPSRLTDLKLHNLIDKLNPSLRARSSYKGKARVREYFELTPEDAYSILDAIAEITDTKQHLLRYNDNLIDSERRCFQMKSVKTMNKEYIPSISKSIGEIEKHCFKYNNTSISAFMTVKCGLFIVEKGSELLRELKPSLQQSIAEKRIDMQMKGEIIDNGRVLKLNMDVSFSSPSAAAKFVAGHSVKGWDYWLDENGKTISSYR